MVELPREGSRSEGGMDLIQDQLVQNQLPPTVVASPIYRGPGPLPKCSVGRDPTTAKFEGGQLEHAILTKVVFACKSLWS